MGRHPAGPQSAQMCQHHRTGHRTAYCCCRPCHATTAAPPRLATPPGSLPAFDLACPVSQPPLLPQAPPTWRPGLAWPGLCAGAGEVWSWGNAGEGALGIGQPKELRQVEPRLVRGLEGECRREEGARPHA